MCKIQFVVNPNPKCIDPLADGYILLYDYFFSKENESLLKNKYTVLDCSMPSDEKYSADKKYVRELASKFISIYAKIINETYSLHLSDRQYKYFIGAWINHFLFDAYDRYQRIKKIKDIDGIFTLMGNSSIILNNQQKYGYLNAYDPDYQMGLYSLIFEKLNLAVKCVDKIYDEYKNTRNVYNLIIKKINKAIRNPEKVIDWVLRCFKIEKIKKRLMTFTEKINIQSKTLVVESRMPKQMEADILMKTGSAVCFVSPQYFVERQQIIKSDAIKADDIRQNIREQKLGINEFECIVCSLIADFMPKSFVEFFKGLYDMSCKITKKWTFKKIYHSAHMTELFAMCCALMSKKGAEIISIQHSAVYCGLKYFSSCECDVWDRFASWGLSLEDSVFSNITRVGMSRLPLKPSSTFGVTKKILMIANMPEVSDSGDGCRYDNYVNEQKLFIENLTDSERENLVIRVITMDDNKTGGLVNWCKRNYPMIKFEDFHQIRFSESLAQSALLVCDYYGSSHLEALMLGRPFTMFEGAKIIGLNSRTKEFLDKFDGFGVYKKTGKELAKEIVAHKNYSEWLYSNELQLLYKKYLNELTRANEDLTELWAKEFIS